MKKIALIIFIIACISISGATQQKTCNGTTKAGKACQSTLIDKSGYCRAHSPLSVRCSGMNKQGKSCQIIVKKIGEYCRYHK